jgi:putative transposase
MRVTNSETGRSFYSKRRKRFDAEHTPRELTFSCYRGYPFLARSRTRLWFIGALQEACTKHSVDLWAWVIMPEHVHLIVFPQKPEISIGSFQGTVKEKVARQGIQWLEQNSPRWLNRITVHEGERTRRRFWQPGGGYDRNIDSIETLLGMIDYFHLNPVRRGLVERAIDWEWSSARWYAGIRPVLLEMADTLPTIHKLGGTP